jgi:ABC-type transporter Mla subunit MlaD
MAQEQKSAAGSGAVKTQPQSLTDAPDNGASATNPPALPPFVKQSPATPDASAAPVATTPLTPKPPVFPMSATPPAPPKPADVASKPSATALSAGAPTLSIESDSASHKRPPPIPNASGAGATGAGSASVATSARDSYSEPIDIMPPDAPSRRSARRRPAGPPRTRIAANDDAPSIGGLIYALDQKPSSKPFKYAAIASAIWAVLCSGFAWAILRAEFSQGATVLEVLGKPTIFLTAAAIVVPVAILWFLALLAWRSEELRLRSSTMTEVAIRLAEPDRMAEQSVASLGQAVRRQVSFMNDAISRALGRAGELEALVHNEVSALERSYEENERKIRGLIQELSGERHALLNTSERVTETLRTLGNDVPALIDKLSNQQVKLAQIIQGAGENLTALESAVGQSTAKLETTLGNKTEQLQTMLEGYTSGLAMALGARTESLQDAISGYVATLDTSLSKRTESLQAVFEEYARALDTSLTNRAQALDFQLVERTKALDAAFGQRLKHFDDQIVRSTMVIDSAVAEKARALTSALDNHAKAFSDTISRQAIDLDESLVHGINSVRRTSENITRQSLKAIEGLSSQSEMLKSVSENLLSQIGTVTNRFEGQGQAIQRAANSLETANYKIDATLQGRHAELSQTIDRLSGKADEFGRFVEGYSSTIEGSIGEAEARARAAAEELRKSSEIAKMSALKDLERFRVETGAEGDRALDDLRRRFSSISNVVSEQLTSLTSRFDQTSEDVRQRAARAAAEIASEQARLREQMDRLPVATRENAEAMRRALQDQLRALEQLSNLTSRAIQNRDVSLPLSAPAGRGPVAPPPTSPRSLTGAYTMETRSQDTHRALSTLATPGGGDAGRGGSWSQETGRSPYQSALPRPGAPTPSDGRTEGWSLGDLLARASREEEGHAPQARQNAPGTSFHSQIDVIARALDPATTSAIWSRLNSGQRGIMVRSIYTQDGRAAFDELTVRYRSDPELKRTVDHYLADFEAMRREAELRDPTGRTANNHLLSDMGRVYLFLAHVSGRIS